MTSPAQVAAADQAGAVTAAAVSLLDGAVTRVGLAHGETSAPRPGPACNRVRDRFIAWLDDAAADCGHDPVGGGRLVEGHLLVFWTPGIPRIDCLDCIETTWPAAFAADICDVCGGPGGHHGFGSFVLPAQAGPDGQVFPAVVIAFRSCPACTEDSKDLT